MKNEPGVGVESVGRSAKDAGPYLPGNPRASLAQHRRAVQACHGCELYKNASQAVFGEGISAANIMLIGEQPGDQEDRQGRVFVGPAGKMMDRALEEIGLARSALYVTNAVKHFKWVPRGKRRLHQKPSSREVKACRPWLQREIGLVKPAVIVCMGATACQSIFGPAFRLTKSRGIVLHQANWGEAALVATVHPSAILRAPDHAGREEQYRAFVADLKVAQKAAKSSLRTKAI
jgi:DNA polymerase